MISEYKVGSKKEKKLDLDGEDSEDLISNSNKCSTDEKELKEITINDLKSEEI